MKYAGDDLVTASDVLEHVPDAAASLREIYAHLRPGGFRFTNLSGAGDAERPMHYDHDDRALLQHARAMGFRIRRPRDRGLWIFEQSAG